VSTKVLQFKTLPLRSLLDKISQSLAPHLSNKTTLLLS